MAEKGSSPYDKRNAAGNESDGLNPADLRYRESMAKQPSSDENDFDNTLAENDYATNRSKKKVDSHGDEIQRNWNEGDDEEANSSQKDLDAKEKAGDSGFKFSGTMTGAAAAATGFRGHLKQGTRRFGPTGGIIFILLFGIVGLGGGSSYLASSLLINIKEIFHNDRADATRTNRLFSRAFISNKFNNDANCAKKTKLCTKMSTMSGKQVKEWVRNGNFTVQGTVLDADGKPTNKSLASQGDADKLDDGDRIRVSEVTYPDGAKAKNGKELFDHADSKTSALRRLENAFASKAAFYTNKFFNDNIITKKFKSTKSQAKYPEGDDEEARKKQDAQFNQEGGFDADESSQNSRANELTSKAESDTKKNNEEGNAKNRGGAVGAVFRGVCTTYQYAKIAETAIKIYHMEQLGRFAILFFRAADQIKDRKGDAPLIWSLGSRLTDYEKNRTMTVDTDYAKKGDTNPKYGLAATDSDGYRVATHGKTTDLKAFAETYVLGGGIGKKIDGFTSVYEDIANKVPGVSGDSGREKVKNMCRLINGNLGALVAGCAGVVAVGQVAGSAAPGLGNIIGAAAGGVGCVCTATSVAGDAAREGGSIIGKILGRVINIVGDAATGNLCSAMERDAKLATEKALELLKSEKVQGWVSEILASLNIDADTKGVDAGNAIAAGAGLMLSTTATGYGLRPSSSNNNNQDITNYIAYTQPLQDTYIALEKDDANQNPLDMENQYSLLGSITRSLAPEDDETPPSTAFGLFSTISNLYASSLKLVTGQPTAEALYNQPSQAANGASGRYDHCDDEDLEYIGATGDSFCSIVGVNSVKELEAATKQAYTPGDQTITKLIDWMQAEQPALEGDNEGSGTACESNNAVDTDSSCKDSKKASIDDNGAPVPGSQYELYLQFCTDARKNNWGGQTESLYAGSERDQDWYSGKQCMHDSLMMRNFRAWTNWCLQSGTMDGDLNCYTATAQTSAPTAASGDACSIMNNPNVILINPGTKEGLKELCEKGYATNSCGNQFTVNKLLFSTIQTLSSKYKIWLNNFGFEQDRNSCDSGQHPKGNAIDINGIERLDGSGRAGGPSWGGITFGNPAQVKVIQDYSSDWLAALPPDRGGVGQKGCSSSFNPVFPAGSVNVNGAAFFADSCDHLHIDIRNRGNLNAV